MRNIIAFFLAAFMCAAILVIATLLYSPNKHNGGAGSGDGEAFVLTAFQSDHRDALYRFRFALNEEEYTLPCQYRTFEKNGWVLRNPAEKIAGCSNMTGVYMKKYHRCLETEIINYSGDSIMCSKGQIHSILASVCDFESINIHGALVFDRTTTPDTLRKMLGDPDEHDEDKDKLALTYIKSEYENVGFVFYKTRLSVGSGYADEESDYYAKPLESGYYNQVVVFECRKK